MSFNLCVYNLSHSHINTQLLKTDLNFELTMPVL